MMDVGERSPGVDHGFQQVNHPGLILHDESLPGARQQELSLPGHRPPETIG
jgi:hypothetical protein